jgi:hypothetical protein
MGIQLLAGRLFDAADEESPRDVVIVDRRLAERSFPDGEAVGRKLYTKARNPAVWVEVVGVVEPQRLERPFGEEQEAMFFTSSWRGARTLGWTLRTSADALALEPAVRSLIAEVDPEIVFSAGQSLDEVVARAHAPLRFSLVVLTLFGAVALGLALVGLYGVLAYSVRLRRHEIGVRLALGAAPRRILGAVLARGLLLVAAGLSLGAAGAAFATRLLAAQLVGVSPLDGRTFAAVPALFLLAAGAACLVPARRAARLDPVRSLRQD